MEWECSSIYSCSRLLSRLGEHSNLSIYLSRRARSLTYSRMFVIAFMHHSKDGCTCSNLVDAYLCYSINPSWTERSIPTYLPLADYSQMLLKCRWVIESTGYLFRVLILSGGWSSYVTQSVCSVTGGPESVSRDIQICVFVLCIRFTC